MKRRTCNAQTRGNLQMAEKPFLQDCLNGRREEGERENRCGERRVNGISGIQGVFVYLLPLLSETKKEQKRGLIEILEE